MSRGTFYNHICRKADCSKYLEEQQALMLQVKQIFDSEQRYGAEKIWIVLDENGVRVGKERIRKIMNELGLVSIREDAKSSYKNASNTRNAICSIRSSKQDDKMRFELP